MALVPYRDNSDLPESVQSLLQQLPQLNTLKALASRKAQASRCYL